ncbi:class I SAM-dependent methyltransferase [Plantactinospora mayteni]|uniref:class I SAM-dependent methyltransferase n=1 Tax=Plantactinospora mayteni TaxID=566021 RepID=UPI0019440035|nr:class I SAM-dependent methyltransferase [Plantactinospora mayteni]
MPSASGSSVYDVPYAIFFERHYTGWVRNFSPDLERYLSRCHGGPGSLLDLCCGSGETLDVFLRAGWTLVGVDLSAAMLARARAKLAPALRSGRLRLVQSDAVQLALGDPVDAVVSLDGALNHLLTMEQLLIAFERVGAALRPGGRFVFDLFEAPHFRHWNRVSVADEDDMIMVKRGAWDETTGAGTRRISGAFRDGAGWRRVAQDLTARHFDVHQVEAQLRRAGLRRVAPGVTMPPCPCGSSESGECRTLFEAVRDPTLD